jgi:poly-gamma-glutamate capsule biosynthesis protein CapA/YwtB (metallophosphatase superfamily)
LNTASPRNIFLLLSCVFFSLPSYSDTSKPPADSELISFTAVGDIMLGSDFPVNSLPKNDAAHFLKETEKFIKAADISMGNLEGVLQDGGTPVKRCNDKSSCYLFRTPTRFAKLLADTGFTVFNMANNHAADFGEKGRSSSMAALDKYGLGYTGKHGVISYKKIKNKDVAIIGFAPNSGAYQLNDLDYARKTVSDLTSKGFLVFVMFHGGAEGRGSEEIPFRTEIFKNENRGDVVKFAHAMIDEGADLVIGSGPHVPRALEVYNNKLIAYSLGNFATYSGINVRGNGGLAPLLSGKINVNGDIVSAKIISFIQKPGEGTILDPSNSASKLIKTLMSKNFPKSQFELTNDGELIAILKNKHDMDLAFTGINQKH